MIWSISWRNVWRNKKRSGIIMCAVAFGLWAGLLTSAVMYGMNEQMVSSAIESRISHIQIHQKGFRDFKEIDLHIPDNESIIEKIRNNDDIEFVTARSVLKGMASSPIAGRGIEIYGINPDEEKHVTTIYKKIIEGEYFGTKYRNQIVIGQELAEKLNVKAGKKIVLTAQSADGDISAGAYRVVGIFKTASSAFDKTTVFGLHKDIDKVFGLGGAIYEISINAKDINKIDELTASMKDDYPALDVASWKQLEPEMGMMTDMTNQFLFIFMVIILIALAFGITNTMLMGVIERVREFGVIIALGMKHGKIFNMILLETIFLSVIGGLVGIIFSILTVKILSNTGIDLTIVSTGLAAFGIDKIIYPVLPIATYPVIGLLTVFTAIISAIYPGVKAVRLNPVTAIRTY
ncbi:MAG: ABC transporter permease [candidate division Zixibacteria bacterium]|nr:ABC transporter permease [candidate division Zixibacteria bacterium]